MIVNMESFSYRME